MFLFSTVSSDTISCEFLGHRKIHDIEILLSTCLFYSFKIDSKDIEIEYNETAVIEEVLFDYNEDVKFLPIKMGETFPSLLSISAWQCSLESVSRENFVGMGKLMRLALNDNHLTIIEAETFADLKNLRWLFLDHNHLKVVDPNAFGSIKSLKVVFLRKNSCIKENFEDENVIEVVIKKVKENCRNPNEIET